METHKILCDFEIQTDRQISVRRINLVIVNEKKRICQIVDFAVPADHWIKLKESEKEYNDIDLDTEQKKKNKKKTMDHEM